ncbi:MAG: SDR family NAD(P)-dependent oxidoreductase [Saprospiraceae bacterium]|nr:SDR family NAD(P)-dependent oxidoreductase [Saprospiraceae bacterium]
MKLMLIGMGPGIGLAVARRFGREGFHILMLARDAEKLSSFEKELAYDGIHATSYAVDIANEAAFTTKLIDLAAEHPDLDILHYNPSAYNPAKPSEIKLPVLMSDLKVNVVGGLLAAQAFWPAMRERGHGVVFFTGGGSAFKAPPDLASLALGKAAMRSLVFTLAQEGKPLGIHVGTVTVCGPVKPNTKLAPDLIAEKFWELYTQKASDSWTTEVIME